jgi:hypothetical protein
MGHGWTRTGHPLLLLCDLRASVVKHLLSLRPGGRPRVAPTEWCCRGYLRLLDIRFILHPLSFILSPVAFTNNCFAREVWSAARSWLGFTGTKSWSGMLPGRRAPCVSTVSPFLRSPRLLKLESWPKSAAHLQPRISLLLSCPRGAGGR